MRRELQYFRGMEYCAFEPWSKIEARMRETVTATVDSSLDNAVSVAGGKSPGEEYEAEMSAKVRVAVEGVKL